MPLSVGQTFAGYRIVRLLGSGGMGEVYLAQHPRLPRHDAIKILPADVSADPEFRQRFEREADLASALWHPNIVGVHDRGEFDGQLWISMDYVDGLDAARLLIQNYPLGMPVDLVAEIAMAVASALDYAHRQGLLHRDVKPANIMLTHADGGGEQRVLLTDFGIARNIDDISGLTATNMTVGTVAYCAPGQLLGEDIDGRADQYALAATAYHLLTGSHLFAHSNPAVVIGRHLSAAPPALADSHPELSALDSVLAVALAKDPGDRFRNCSDFAQAFGEQIRLESAVSTVATTQPAAVLPESPPSSQSPAGGVPPKRSGKNMPGWKVAAVYTAVAALLMAAIALGFRTWENRSPVSSISTSALPGTGPSAVASFTPPPPPPRPPIFPADAVDSVLLTAPDVSSLLGVGVAADPADGVSALKMKATSYGPSDHSAQVTPPSCVGVVFTAENHVYGSTGFQNLKTQTFDRGLPESVFESLEQTAVVFPSLELAERLLALSSSQWNTCSSSTVQVSLGYEKSWGFTLGAAERHGSVLTVPMAAWSDLNGEGITCQQALGARENVIVAARVCEVLHISADVLASIHRGWSSVDPNWASDDAAKLVISMLDKVKV